MTAANHPRRGSAPNRSEDQTHLFAIGQAVRLKGGFGQMSRASDVYRITGTLPPRGDQPQYRIRNEAERHERVAMQDTLEPLRTAPGEGAALIERTFGHG
ncbi:hypothetical protein [Prosthecomicrobium hirschii]|jgi:hypothetical protein|uniref:Uncharacterized protein n=1 Tax=Prosthecodimorpha hirschii TaxID=665126 RepID=A0A0P6VNI6_9HYPH|nr:hypothetical protein [Prosthecomicrobium hirschii]KPL52838.1 hypothetical protein ABB55_11955 [Prosthecomicrobium hirschii]MCW1841788.1 hypothetical protein [Prosthecomicrobium hirschii]TPQ50935.1 hypothetical protein C2U72_10960 [Prosthecomicrobium hirschii]